MNLLLLFFNDTKNKISISKRLNVSGLRLSKLSFRLLDHDLLSILDVKALAWIYDALALEGVIGI